MNTDPARVAAAQPTDDTAAATAAPGRPPRARSLAVVSGIFASGNLLSTFLKTVGGLLTARLVEPAVLGLFASVTVVLNWIPFLQLGVLNGLNRELPYLIGTGRRDRAERLTAAAGAWAQRLAAAVAAAMLAIAVVQAARGRWDLALAWSSNAVATFGLFYGQLYLQATYRTGGEFARLAVYNVIHATLNVALVVLVWLFSFYGLPLRAALLAGAQLTMLFIWRPIRVRPAWDWQGWKHLLRIGAPIFAVGQLYVWWTALNATLVLAFSGTRALGLFALVNMAGPTMILFPQAVSAVLYPRMAERWGRTHDVRAVARMALKPTLALVAAMIPLVAVGWFALPPLALLLLPKYAQAIPAAQWSLVAAGLAALNPVNNLFNVVRRQGLAALAMAAGVAVHLAMLPVIGGRELPLTAYVQSLALGRLVYTIGSLSAVAYLCKKSGSVPSTDTG